MRRRRIIPGSHSGAEPLACLGLLLSLGGCESGGMGSSKDAAGGGDAGQDAGAELKSLQDAARDPGLEAAAPEVAAEAPPPAMDRCDVLKQDCASGQVCYVTCPSGTASCQTDQGGTGTQWATCSGALGTCAKGFECIGTPSGYLCLKYCKTASDCTAGGSCVMITTNPACGGRPLPAGACYGTPPMPDAGVESGSADGSSG